AGADGDIGAKEMAALKQIGQAVGFDPARYL
ncbi:tellurite resistance TerB family protein, partial [Streptococcus pseudopneumoniae]|nr:tellurite resistance TerB family protein [Streptococcus pseudopneumoniae]